jgi:hypothetical protein
MYTTYIRIAAGYEFFLLKIVTLNYKNVKPIAEQ